MSEVKKRIFDLLNLNHTTAGYPVDVIKTKKEDRVTTCYTFNTDKQAFEIDKNIQQLDTAYPSAGIFTNLIDLAAYTTALDTDALITQESYQKITSPFVNVKGEKMPYGLGWFT